MNFRKTLSLPLALLFILAGLLMSGCQKESLSGPKTDDSTLSSPDFNQDVLRMIYGMDLEQASSPESEVRYRSITEALTESQHSQLEQLVQQYTAQPETKTPVSSRSVAEILSTGVSGDGFGQSVAKAGDKIAVGLSGKVHLYSRDGSGSYALEQSITGRSGFGAQVAASSGRVAVLASSSRQVYIYKDMGTYWGTESLLSTGLDFVADIAMSGSTLAVMGGLAGSVDRAIKVYANNGAQWVEQAQLSLDDTFFWDIDIDGGIIAANGGTNSDLGVVFSPKVYVFSSAGGSWGLSQEIAFPFGYQLSRAVAISGSTIIANTAFYLFAPSTQTAAFTSSSGSWAFSGQLVQPGPLPFVQTRELDIQGSTAVVTVPTGEFFPDPNDVAHVFNRSGSSWSLANTLTPSGGGFSILFGQSVALGGGEIVIGAPGSGAGKVFIY